MATGTLKVTPELLAQFFAEGFHFVNMEGKPPKGSTLVSVEPEYATGDGPSPRDGSLRYVVFRFEHERIKEGEALMLKIETQRRSRADLVALFEEAALLLAPTSEGGTGVERAGLYPVLQDRRRRAVEALDELSRFVSRV